MGFNQTHQPVGKHHNRPLLFHPRLAPSVAKVSAFLQSSIDQRKNHRHRRFHLQWLPVQEVRPESPLAYCFNRRRHQHRVTADQRQILNVALSVDDRPQYHLALHSRNLGKWWVRWLDFPDQHPTGDSLRNAYPLRNHRLQLGHDIQVGGGANDSANYSSQLPARNSTRHSTHHPSTTHWRRSLFFPDHLHLLRNFRGRPQPSVGEQLALNLFHDPVGRLRRRRRWWRRRRRYQKGQQLRLRQFLREVQRQKDQDSDNQALQGEREQRRPGLPALLPFVPQQAVRKQGPDRRECDQPALHLKCGRGLLAYLWTSCCLPLPHLEYGFHRRPLCPPLLPALCGMPTTTARQVLTFFILIIPLRANNAHDRPHEST